MANFEQMKQQLINNFEEKINGSVLYEVDVDKDVLWNLYLDSFPEGTNNVYRTRREYDCSCCRQFIKNIGGTVYISDDLEVHTLFEFATNDVFQPVMNALDEYVRSRPITGLYLNESWTVGCDRNHEILDDGTVKTWEHFFLKLPSQCVCDKHSIGERKGRFHDRNHVFKRSLDMITMDAINTVLELIYSNSLYKGEEWKKALETFKSYKEKYDSLSEDKKDIYTWHKTYEVSDVIGKIRNHSIGVLLIEISDGKELDEAVRRYESIVAPINYKRPKAIYTKKMLEDAKKTITELGYLDSLPRRFATLDDITVNNILFSNRDVAKRLGGDVFDEMMTDIPVKKFSRVEEISIDSFVKDVLPNAREVEVLLENKHAPSMMSLIAPVNKEAPSMFKWANPYSWAYSGNITDSDIRENVKAAGGAVDGVLRYSIQWNDGKEYNGNDLDAHCVETFGDTKNRIYFARMISGYTHGVLDVDVRIPKHGKPAVENITWPSKTYMKPGVYQFMVHNYTHRGGRGGFRAEIEFDGNIYSFNYLHDIRPKECVEVATVTLDKNGNFSIKEHIPSEMSTRELWGLKTNTFVPVSAIMYSPNYWDEQSGIGHRHYFFMLKDCVNPEKPNGFFNEYLKHDLEQHKRVFEALGGKMAVKDTNDQLSGIGFSSTKRNELTVKVKGATERVMKIKF